MKKIYFSAVLKVRENVSPVVGVEMQAENGYSFDELKKRFQFIVNRYFGNVEMLGFGRITKKAFDCVNIRISDL